MIYPIDSDLTFATVIDLKKSLQQPILSAPEQVCFDLSGVKQCDSAGLALLLECFRFAKKHDKTLGFKQCPPQLLALAQVSGIQEMLLNG